MGSINSLCESLKSSMLLEDLVGSVKCASLDKGGLSQFAEHKDTFSPGMPVHLSPRDPGKDTRTPRATLIHSCWLQATSDFSVSVLQLHSWDSLSPNSLTVSVATSFADILARFGHSKLITI